MKKLLLLTFIAITGFTANAQFTAGVSGGLPIGDAGDLATFSIAVDLGYLFEISDNFSAGPITGFSHSFGDEITILGTTFDVEDVQFIPIGAGGRFGVSDTFTLGADLGYALGVNDGNDGGFYYSPRVQYSISELIDLVLAYRGVSLDGGSWDIISFGFEFGID
ncbi:MAG: outer membrane beta-barrel protein [Flavobacteriaceae bacterium]